MRITTRTHLGSETPTRRPAPAEGRLLVAGRRYAGEGITILRVDFQTRAADTLATLDAALPGALSVQVENALRVDDDEWELVLTVVDHDDVRVAVEALPECSLIDLNHLAAESDVYHLQLLVTGVRRFVVKSLLRANAVPERVALADGRHDVTATVRDWQHMKALAEAIEAEYGSFSLVAVEEVDHPGFPLGSANLAYVVRGKMTDDQVAILETAFREGFFEVPQRITEAELAAAFGISQSTVSERVRTALHQLLSIVFGTR
ncbi:MAG: helix-turn-helix domain-containing protein [Salinigranum sp.]